MARSSTMHSPGSIGSHDDQHSGGEDNGSKHHSIKDRECQFCHQKFTSSSLGRHLDQFLHKKKPDGLHNVDEIRRLRGGITRRTARHSSKNGYDESRASNASPAPTQSPVVDTLNAPPTNGIGVRINEMNWHSTGVINDLKDISAIPTTLASASPVSMPLTTKRNFSTYAGIDQPSPRPSNTDTEKDTTIRALELSLREVLDSVRAATARSTPRPSPFTFELKAQTFPALVLRLLHTPPTLFSSTPFATSTSAPISPPNSSHLPLLRLNLESKIQTWKWDALRHAQSLTFPTAHAANLGEEADYLGRTASQYEDFARKHVDASFAAWSTLSASEQASTWTLEVLRAFATKSQKNKELEEKLETLTTEANRLQEQVEYLSRCQWPRELALWPPEPVRFSKMASEEIRGINLDVEDARNDAGRSGGTGVMTSKEVSEKWEYEKLVGKWRRRVREDRNRRMPVVGTPRMSELQRERESVTPPAVNGDVGETRRKSARQSQGQGQQLVTSMADQDEKVREFNKNLQAMNDR